MDIGRARLLLAELSKATGYDLVTEPHLDVWRVRNGEQEGWIALQDVGDVGATVVASFPVCVVPTERRGSFERCYGRT